ncbi:MAG: hypothetical protein PHX58_01650 [Desulfovibrio sp.]|nr:hypothetical protein [Desulfovibrio sp.]
MAADQLQFITFGTLITSALFTFLQSRRKFGIGTGFILFTGSYSAFLLCSVDDVNNFVMPDYFFQARPEKLQQLGMFLFPKLARDVKQLHISGYSFSSFVIGSSLPLPRY